MDELRCVVQVSSYIFYGASAYNPKAICHPLMLSHLHIFSDVPFQSMPGNKQIFPIQLLSYGPDLTEER